MGDRDALVLVEAERLQVLAERLPGWTRGAVPQVRPVVVVVAGQPGAGKTAIADLVQSALERRGGAVRIGRDLYKPAHRHYAAALAADVRTAGAAVRPDTTAWQAAVEEHVQRSRFDAVVESALADLDDFRASSAAYRRSRHRIEIVALATAEAWSQLGILNRFLTEDRRYVSWENHDTCATRMLTVLAAAEAQQLADRITVVTRDGTVLYD
ncbi:zeta toxin family protein, partial [Streptomyces hydrogenans]|uniref:zeta toxin family protein n=1 Tax=Streptomyces hydrogenans TaxID=1873719 RepID=UPI00367D1428